jgi:hypothetical protein
MDIAGGIPLQTAKGFGWIIGSAMRRRKKLSKIVMLIALRAKPTNRRIIAG